MAKISDERLDEFIKIYRSMGHEFESRAEAREAGNALIEFFKIIMKIDYREKNLK